jgi:hypothetical protein
LPQNEKLMYEIAQENKRLSEPLSKALKEVEALRQALANYDKDKLSLSQTKARLGASEKQVRRFSLACSRSFLAACLLDRPMNQLAGEGRACALVSLISFSTLARLTCEGCASM